MMRFTNLRPRHPKKGFTLVELMMVVAIIGTLASIAIPSFMGFMVKARRAERTLVLSGMRTSMEFYWQGKNSWQVPGGGGSSSVASVTNPTDTPWSSGKKPFNQNVQYWNELAFAPSGNMWYSYSFSGTATSATTSSFTLQSLGDVNFNGIQATHTETYQLQGDGNWVCDPNTMITDLPVNEE